MAKRIGGRGPDELIGDDDDDELRGRGGDDLIRGKGGADRLFGDAGEDEIYGGDGRDRIAGGRGNDLIRGGASRDELAGGDGRDRIGGGGGGDLVDGGKGRDKLRGGGGSDVLVGGEGDDIIAGDDGDDRIKGNQGADSLGGGAGDDTIRGGSGADRLFGDAGDNRLFGGKGADQFALSPDLPGSSEVRDFDFDAGDRILLDVDANADGRLDATEYGAWRAAMQDVAVSTDDAGTNFTLAPASGAALAPAAAAEAATIRLAEAYLGGGMARLAIHDFGLNAGQEQQVPTNPSRAFDGTEDSSAPALSGTGRFLGLISQFNLDGHEQDPRGSPDAFVFDVLVDRAVRVNTNAAGDLPTYSASESIGDDLAISSDGRYVAFVSNANNLLTEETRGDNRVLVKDLLTGAVHEVSEGVPLPEPSLVNLDMSADGGTIVFTNDGAAFLSAGGRPAARIELAAGVVGAALADDASRVVLAADDARLFLVELGRATPAVRFLSAGAGPDLSADGRFVTYEDGGQILRRDIDGGEVVVVSRSEDGGLADGVSSDASISGNGQIVAFASTAENLVPNDTNSLRDVFVKNLATGELARVTIDERGQQAFDDPHDISGSFEPSISANGDFVAYTTVARNLQDLFIDAPPDPAVGSDDLTTGRTVIWSVVDYDLIAAPDLRPDAQTIAVLSPGGSVASDIAAIADIDLLRVPAEADRFYRFTVTADPLPASNVGRPFVRLLAENDEGGFDLIAAAEAGVIDHWSTDASPLFIGAQGNTRVAPVGVDNDFQEVRMFLGDYRVALRTIDLPDDPSSPATLAIDDAVRQAIERAGDRDWYGVQLEAGQEYRFRMRGESSGGGTLRDPQLELYDDGGRLLVRGQDDVAPGTNLDSLLEFEPTTTARYFVSAEASESVTGTYTLSSAEVFTGPPIALPPVVTLSPVVDPTPILAQAHPDEIPPGG